ncbi:MAG: PilZ domain-containing protein [Treponema sp.]|nr:PilZ domain-containing protein [Treponema sp.]
MPLAISILVVFAFAVLLSRLYHIYKDKIDFFARGMDYGFKYEEISSLWKLAAMCELEDPLSLFVSENSVNQCIAYYIANAKEEDNFESFKVQQFLEKLYKFKTRVALDADKKRGLESTKAVDEGQKLSIIYKGKGVFISRVLNNGREFVIALPMQQNKKTGRVDYLKPEEWVGKTVSVYFWRKGDAGYSFDTEVFSSGVFRSDNALYLKHSFNLIRTQKRQSIRCACEINAQLYMIGEEGVDYEKIETEDGYKCLLEDISEDGAMIRVGGKAVPNVQIKIQFQINEALIVMFGVIRGVEFNAALNQSRIHFECTHIDSGMKNKVLSYVYNIIPQEEQEVHDAMVQAEEQNKLEEEETQGETSLEPLAEPSAVEVTLSSMEQPAVKPDGTESVPELPES